ncbi:hypothetical protein MUP77_06690 [Candidatus Bathyarchaeota archaeon]|nr:hypothetical protein [Candidatus Bathyarchaeota archaeon]
MDGLAAHYLSQGLRVSNEKPRDSGGHGGSENEVVDAVAKALEGAIPKMWIKQHIDAQYIQKDYKQRALEAMMLYSFVWSKDYARSRGREYLCQLFRV